MANRFGELLNNRLHFVADMNLDGAVTISDAWLWFKWLFFLPGDFVLLVLLDTGIGNFFEITLFSMQGVGSAIFSFVAWFVALGFLDAVVRKSSN